MHQVKIFKSIESEIPTLEEEMNQWLSESGAQVISITGNIAAQSTNGGALCGSFSGSDVILFVLYEKS